MHPSPRTAVSRLAAVALAFLALLGPARSPAQTSPGPAEEAPPGPTPGVPADDAPAYRARRWAERFPAEPLAPLGTLDEASDYEGAITFTRFGAGIESLRLTRHFETVRRQEHIRLQAARRGDTATVFAEERFTEARRLLDRLARTTADTERAELIDQTQEAFAGLGFPLDRVALEAVTDDAAAESIRLAFVARFPRLGVPFAALSIDINGERVGLADARVWRELDGTPGAFEAVVETASGVEALRVTRRFSYEPDSFDLRLDQTFENLTGEDLRLYYLQTGPIDLPIPDSKYGGDKRRVRFGYLLDQTAQGSGTLVRDDNELAGRTAVLGDTIDGPSGEYYAEVEPLWPTEEAEENGWRLVWTAYTDAFFGVAVHKVVDPNLLGTPGGEPKLLDAVGTIDRIVLNPYAARSDNSAEDAVTLTRLNGTPRVLPAGASDSISWGIYAGPLTDDAINADALAVALNLDEMIARNLGGICAPCTFPFLTDALFGMLKLLHSLTQDWALAIMLLVVVVRTVLHPVFRWSQIRTIRFGKQMQALAPKQKKLREKYKHDQKQMQQEMARLMQEEGVNPAGALGCLPMFMQMPVWIALYATLYFAAEMRHEPAFYGFFQAVSGGEWAFLADLTRPDAMLPLGPLSFTPPLIGGLYGRVDSINILPILMAVGFYLQMNYLTPQQDTSNLSPEMRQQQKIMKVLFPVMTPIFMYAAPSGLAIYFLTNSTLGILENRHIRKDAEAKGLLDPKRVKEMKAERRRQGRLTFLEKLQQAAQAKAAQKAQARYEAENAPGKRRVSNTAKKGPAYKRRK